MIAIFSRYLGVQVFAYAIDMGIFLLLSAGWGAQPITANVIAKMTAGAFAFVLHRRVTFTVHGRGGSGGQLFKYALLLALNIPVASGFLALLLPWIAPVAMAKFIADVICVGLTFLVSRHVVFTPPRQAGPD